jgi:DEAD/DEAH box helicase domain-containing protein
MDTILVFDLETQYSADEVGGWSRIRDMRLSVGVTYDVLQDTYRCYTESEAPALVAALRAADLVVGYNVMRFDYEVLHRYTPNRLNKLPTLDMLVDLHRTLGWRPSLDAVAAATLGESKSADGLQAVRWFRDGHVQKVIDYCRRDVEVTWRVYDFGQRNGYVQCRDRRWRTHRVPVRWRQG